MFRTVADWIDVVSTQIRILDNNRRGDIRVLKKVIIDIILKRKIVLFIFLVI